MKSMQRWVFNKGKIDPVMILMEAQQKYAKRKILNSTREIRSTKCTYFPSFVFSFFCALR